MTYDLDLDVDRSRSTDMPNIPVKCYFSSKFIVRTQRQSDTPDRHTCSTWTTEVVSRNIFTPST